MNGDALRVEQIRIHPGTATRQEAMAEAAEILAAAGAVTSATAYAEAMAEREETVSTYMGNELAVPHGTNQTQDLIVRSAVSFVRYDGGVDWGGAPVNFVIGLAGQGADHLTLLSRISLLFSETEENTRFWEAQTPAELFELLRVLDR